MPISPAGIGSSGVSTTSALMMLLPGGSGLMENLSSPSAQLALGLCWTKPLK
jgi:hypothetical protein